MPIQSCVQSLGARRGKRYTEIGLFSGVHQTEMGGDIAAWRLEVVTHLLCTANLAILVTSLNGLPRFGVGILADGAIGSEYKVDASYLSPNVNMSARLEAATKVRRCRLTL